MRGQRKDLARLGFERPVPRGRADRWYEAMVIFFTTPVVRIWLPITIEVRHDAGVTIEKPNAANGVVARREAMNKKQLCKQ